MPLRPLFVFLLCACAPDGLPDDEATSTAARLEGNHAPVVTASRNSGPCIPNCHATFEVTAADTDGDALTYAWSGCATGATGAKASCAVSSTAGVAATVTVSDGHGGSVQKSFSAYGYSMAFANQYLLHVETFKDHEAFDGTYAIGWVKLNGDHTAVAEHYLLRTQEDVPSTKHHNAMDLDPHWPPTQYDPNCTPGPVWISAVRKKANVQGSWYEYTTPAGKKALHLQFSQWPLYGGGHRGYDFDWTVEHGAPTESLRIARAGDFTPGSEYDFEDVYGYAFLSAVSPRFDSALSLPANFASKYFNDGAKYNKVLYGDEWHFYFPELTDAYVQSQGGFLWESSWIFYPPTGFHAQSDPVVQGYSYFNNPDHTISPVYAHWTLLTNYTDGTHPFLSNSLVYANGGNDYSDDGCMNEMDHRLMFLGVIENGKMTKVVDLETSQPTLRGVGRAFRLYPPEPDTAAPTGTLGSIPSPTTARLTSRGYATGTLAGTAQDDVAVAGVDVVIRRGAGGCTGSQDWNGSAWVQGCTAAALPAQLAGATWTMAQTPPLGQMTTGSYFVFVNVRDAAGHGSGWSPNQAVQFVAPPPTPLTCAPGIVQIPNHSSLTLAATGGTGTYAWSATAATPSTGTGPTFTATYSNPTGLTLVTHTVVTSGGQSASCTVKVLP